MRIVPARSAVPVLAVLLALAAGGCSSSAATSAPQQTSETSRSAATLTAADRGFVTDLLANHRQAVELSALLGTKSGVDPQVRVLAEDVSASQQGVVEELEAFPVSAGDTATSTSGAPEQTLPQAELEGLAEVDGPQSGRIYLQAMVGSHIEAVQLARTEVARGADPAAVALAERVVTDRAAEIDQMRLLLGGV